MKGSGLYLLLKYFILYLFIEILQHTQVPFHYLTFKSLLADSSKVAFPVLTLRNLFLLAFVGVGLFDVDPRFHPMPVLSNLGSTWEFPTAAFAFRPCVY